MKAKVGADDFVKAGGLLARLQQERIGLAVDVEDERYIVRWREHKVKAIFTELYDHGPDVAGVLSVHHEGTQIVWGRLDLASMSKRMEIVRTLSETLALPRAGWRYIIEQSCFLVAVRFHECPPAVLLGAKRRPPDRQQIVGPHWEAEGATVLFGDGSKGKGWLGLLSAIAVRTGERLGAFTPTLSMIGPVLYLDWESSQEAFEHRLAVLGSGLGMGLADLIHYRRMVRPLHDEMAAVRQDCKRIQPVALVIDSMVPAAGREPEGADASTRIFNALRALGRPALVIAHVSASSAVSSGPARPYGSVFNWNLARAAWEVTAEIVPLGDSEALTIGVFNRKRPNEGTALPPFGMEITFTPAMNTQRVTVASHNLHTTTSEVFIQKMASHEDRLLAVLASGPKTTDEVKVAAGFSTLEAAKKALTRAATPGKTRPARVVKLEEGGGRGRTSRWGLATPRDAETGT